MSQLHVAVFGANARYLVSFRGPLMQEMRACGHEVSALAPDFDGETRSELSAIGVTPVEVSLSRTGMNPFVDLRDFLRLCVQLRRLKPDVLLGIAIKPVAYGMLAAAAAGVSRRFALITGLGYVASESSSLAGRIVRSTVCKLYGAALKRAETVFVQNPDDANELVDRKLTARGKVVRVNGTGLDLAAWPKMDLPEPPITFTLAARLLAEKGVREYVAAARRVKAEYPAVRFLLLGGVDTNPSAINEAEVASWVADGVVEWPGYVDVRPWLSQTSVFVLPSYREGVPRSSQEALAAGRPLITTDAPGCRETVVSGQNGILVPPRDVESLVNAMLYFIENPQQISHMGHHSRQLAEARFDVRAINEKMLSVMGLDGSVLLGPSATGLKQIGD